MGGHPPPPSNIQGGRVIVLQRIRGKPVVKFVINRGRLGYKKGKKIIVQQKHGGENGGECRGRGGGVVKEDEC